MNPKKKTKTSGGKIASTLAALIKTNESLVSRLESLEKSPGTAGTKLLPAEAIDHDEKRRRGFKSHVEFLLAVQRAAEGKGLDKRLSSCLIKTAGSDEGMASSDPYGGFLIPPAFAPQVLMVEPEKDPMGGQVQRVPMGSPQVKINARVDKNHTSSVSGGLVVYRHHEALDITSSRVEYEQIMLDAQELIGLSYATESVLQDSPQTFLAMLQRGFQDQFTYKIIDERINGTGNGGQFLGVLNSPCLVTVSKETGQAANTITYDNIIKMRSRCWHYENAIWLANHDTSPQLMTLAQETGVTTYPIWATSGREDRPDTLLGRPIVFTEYCETLGTVGDIILGVWSEYLEGLYQGPEQAESLHVRFVQHERAFKFWVRNAGAPWWRSALTPKNSSNTLSPFVVLATRA